MYVSLAVLGTVAGLFGIGFRVYQIRNAYVEKAGSVRRASVAAAVMGGSGSSAAAKVRKKHQLSKARRNLIGCCISIGVFLLEDAPLAGLNIAILLAGGTSARTHTETVVMFSLLVNMVGCGLKLASLKRIKDLLSELKAVTGDLKMIDATSATITQAALREGAQEREIAELKAAHKEEAEEVSGEPYKATRTL